MTFAPSTDEATVVTVAPSDPLAQQTVLRILAAVPTDEFRTAREIADAAPVSYPTVMRYADVLEEACEHERPLGDYRRRVHAFKRPFDAVRIEL